MKEFKNNKIVKTNYYVVSIDDKLGRGLIEKIKINDIPIIKEEGKYKFTLTYNASDHLIDFPCKIVEETVVTYKTYKDI